MKAFAQTTMIFYIVAIAVSGAAVYYLNSAYNQPQPTVSVTYNAQAQVGVGYIINTLPIPIKITAIYCTVPSGEKLVFGSPNNNTLASGSNTSIEVGVANKSTMLPTNCTDWRVSYMRVSESQVANQQSNSPFGVS